MTKIKLMTLNLRGAKRKGTFARLVNTLSRWRQDKGVSALAAQEHNLSPDDKAKLVRTARARGWTLIIGFAPLSNGVNWGGTLLLLDDSVVITT